MADAIYSVVSVQGGWDVGQPSGDSVGPVRLLDLKALPKTGNQASTLAPPSGDRGREVAGGDSTIDSLF